MLPRRAGRAKRRPAPRRGDAAGGTSWRYDRRPRGRRTSRPGAAARPSHRGGPGTRPGRRRSRRSRASTSSSPTPEGNPNASAYSAAKAGVIALTKSLAQELARHEIAANCITPAAARTRIFDQMTPAHIDFMLSRIPRGRFLKVEELASLAT